MQEDMFEGDENACGIYCGDGFMDVCLSPTCQLVYTKYVQLFGCQPYIEGVYKEKNAEKQ